MQAAEELKMERMVHIGTASSFNNGSKENPGNETNAYTGSKFKMDYIDSKYEAQICCLTNLIKLVFPVIIINPTFMIGRLIRDRHQEKC
jgi:nucleoside-diphosphate-sugar epimerase